MGSDWWLIFLLCLGSYVGSILREGLSEFEIKEDLVVDARDTLCLLLWLLWVSLYVFGCNTVVGVTKFSSILLALLSVCLYTKTSCSLSPLLVIYELVLVWVEERLLGVLYLTWKSSWRTGFELGVTMIGWFFSIEFVLGVTMIGCMFSGDGVKVRAGGRL